VAQTVEYYQQKLRQAQTDLNFARSTGDPNSIRVFTARFLAAQNDLETAQQALAGTPPVNAVDPAVSPAAAQADASADEEVGFFGRLFGTSGTDDDVSEFAEYGSDLSTPLPAPQPTPAAEPTDVDPNTNIDGWYGTEETVREIPQRPPQDAVDRAFGVFATPEIDDNQSIDEFTTIVQDENGQVIGYTEPNDVAGGQVDGPSVRIATPVNDQQAQDQQQVPRTVENTAANEDIITEQEQQAQINRAALDRLRQQSAAQQQRQPEGTGDWRVKLRLASDSNYLYNADWNVDGNAGILRPLLATDGIVFPYTPSIQILYAADYNTYHPTHSNYQHYFYKGSKVGEVVMTATFTAQDTAEANYLLAVIHFLKSASKMFYGQDPERGSPPPLLFLTGLGDYQFNEAPCVISQFNYVLPNDVDYIRANVSQIRAGQTLQTDLRNKSTGGNSTWSASINRLLTTPGLFAGAENPTSRISSQTANLSSDNATYVPTKIEMTITLLPVQNRLQVSEQFSLKEYANGKLIQRGFW
jgi:hypothetical protein